LFDFAEDASDNPTFYADLHEPQSLNKYQYSYNNPLRYVDPDGHGIKDRLKAAASTAVQVVKDTAVGAAKSAFNTVAETASLVNVGVDAAISPVTDFRFGLVPTAQASTPGEKSAMIATDIVTVVAGGVGAARGIIRGASRLARAGAAVETGEAAQSRRQELEGREDRRNYPQRGDTG
jgi:hypothetical protein